MLCKVFSAGQRSCVNSLCVASGERHLAMYNYRRPPHPEESILMISYKIYTCILFYTIHDLRILPQLTSLETSIYSIVVKVDGEMVVAEYYSSNCVDIISAI